MTTYEYKFIKVQISVWTGKPKEDPHEIIREQARQGWRFVQLVHGLKHHYELELIFERPV